MAAGATYSIAPDGLGGIVVANIDSTLAVNVNPIGVPATDLGNGLGVETAALLTQPLLPATQPPAPTDFGSVIATWHTLAGAFNGSISAQKLGCCREVYDVDRVPNPWPYRCAIPIDFQQSVPGAVTASFPCSREGIGSFGVLPLPHLGRIPGVRMPGGLLNTRVKPPSWVRLEFSGIPSDVQIALCSHTSVRIGVAKPAADSTIRTLTFKPDPKLSYALALTRPAGPESGAQLTFGVDVAFGEGRRLPSARRKSRQTARQRSGRKR